MKTKAILSAVAFVWLPLVGHAKTAKPNILLILADDLGYADLGVQGCTQFQTPHIDSIAGRGMRFTNGYVSNSVCSPSRAGLLSGRIDIGFEHNLPQHSTDGLNEGLETMADMLRRAGYRTSCIGKWHLGELDKFHPNRRGFDHFCGLLEGSRGYFPEPDGSDKAGNPRRIQTNGKPTDFEGYLTDFFSDHAVSIITEHVEKTPDRPFFMYLAYTAPHAPMQAKEETLARFSHIKNPKRRAYAAMVHSLDEGVGRVLRTLDQKGLAENTLVVFLSDNGGPLEANGSGNTPLKGAKGSLWEGGVRVPFLLRWPAKLTAGRNFDEPVSSLDLLPTFAAAAGVEPVAKACGIDLLPVLADPSRQLPARDLFWRRGDMKNRAMRSGPYKWVSNRGTGEEWLFDLGKDVEERHNLAEHEPAVLEKMRGRCLQWEQSIPPPRFASGWTPAKAKAGKQ